MTYFEPAHNSFIPQTPPAPASWLSVAMMRLWMAALGFVLGLSREDMIDQAACSGGLNRARKRQDERTARRAVPPGRNLSALKPLAPRAHGAVLTPTQRLERLTRIAAMGRFQIYNFLYYRHEFWRIGAIRTRAVAPSEASGPVPEFQTCGLSDAHAWPD